MFYNKNDLLHVRILKYYLNHNSFLYRNNNFAQLQFFLLEVFCTYIYVCIKVKLSDVISIVYPTVDKAKGNKINFYGNFLRLVSVYVKFNAKLIYIHMYIMIQCIEY